MELFKVNNNLTYVDNPYVKNNSFISQKVNSGKIPTYDEIANKLPKPFWEGHKAEIEAYNFTWKTAFKNLRNICPKSKFVSDFIDTAFNGFLFMWDSAFIVMFGKYAVNAFNFQQTLDNFYSNQHRDGFICREICEAEPGEHFSRDDPASTGPNILPWSEWEYYTQSGDTERLKRVFDPLMAYHKWLRLNRTWPDGTYWTCGWGCGMDNQPRVMKEYSEQFSHGHQIWADCCMQQVLSAKILIKIAKILNRENETEDLKKEVEILTSVINNRLWNEEESFYFDLWKNGRHNYVKTVGAYWALLADIVPKERAEAFISHLDNEKEFKTPNRVPALSKDDPNYRADGDYWNGGVWAPTTYMVLKGLDRYGCEKLANEIADSYYKTVIDVFKKTNTLWENYSPELSEHGRPAKPDFVGWTGLAATSVFFEYIFGIKCNMREKKLIWNIRQREKHGVLDFPFNNCLVDLICEGWENGKPIVNVKKSSEITVEIIYGECEKIIL